MKSKQIKWLLCLAVPFLFLLIPFSGGLKFKQFKTIVLQPQKTGIATFNFHDPLRNRPVITEVWYPIDQEVPAQNIPGFWMRCDEARDAPLSQKQQKYPLIVMSHGSGVDRFNLSWLAEVLAANGYIVAAMDHYGNTWNNKIPELYATPWERPQDVSFVIDQLLSSSPFADRIDQKKIGFTGYSLGGATGIWIAGAQAGHIDATHVKSMCAKELAGIVSDEILEKIDYRGASRSYKDSRIGAAIVMAPALGWMFDEKSLQKIQIPVHIIAPSKDQLVPIEKNAQIFAKNITRASLQILSGDTNHYIFLNRATLLGKRMLDPKYYEDPSSIDRRAIHQDLAKNAVEFFDNHLK